MKVAKPKFSPELLAPAGNMEMALAALDAGADALYVGMSRFSARERAGNFTGETLGMLLEHARKMQRKVYVAVNTLVKESELDPLAEQLAELSRLQPDALIVQDPGVVQLAHEYFPNLRLHASTQMGIHNTPGVATAAKLGIQRVILERQVTLAELEGIARKSPVELEVFIHGSLCSSLSGRCLFSSWFGGESGNRGRCKQPCRRCYQAEESGKNGFFFSLSDLNAMDLLEEFRRLKIASLKIEGRLRSPDYVAKVVRAYRLALDGGADALPEAQRILATASARRSTLGFYQGSFRKLPQTEALGAFGIPVGTVRKATRAGLSVDVSGRVHLGDRLRLVPPDGGEGAAFTLIKMECNRREAVKAQSGQTVWIPGEYEARDGWQLYKIGENGCDYRRRAEALAPLRFPVEIVMALQSDGFHGRLPLAGDAEFFFPFAFQPPQKHALDGDDVAAMLATGEPAPWRAGHTQVTVDGSWFCPAAVLKEMRRAFWSWAEERLRGVDARPEAQTGLDAFRAARRRQEAIAPDGVDWADAFVIPGFIAEGKVAEWTQRVRRAYADGTRKFVVAGWHGWEMLRGWQGLQILGAPPFPICNSMAAELVKNSGGAAVAPWPELESPAVAAFAANSPLPLIRNVTLEARLPLLVSRAPLAVSGRISDGRGHSFEVRYDKEAELTFLYPAAGETVPYPDGEWK